MPALCDAPAESFVSLTGAVGGSGFRLYYSDIGEGAVGYHCSVIHWTRHNLVRFLWGPD